MAYKPERTKSVHGGTQRLYRFPNGYGASVVRHQFSYGHESDLWELAVITNIGENCAKFTLCYSTPITDDVLGYLSDENVEEMLDRIAALPAPVAA